jgi:hypothetical protein
VGVFDPVTDSVGTFVGIGPDAFQGNCSRSIGWHRHHIPSLGANEAPGTTRFRGLFFSGHAFITLKTKDFRRICAHLIACRRNPSHMVRRGNLLVYAFTLVGTGSASFISYEKSVKF